MDVFEAITKRHSYRGDFTQDIVPRADLVRIVEAGIMAPSGKNAQTTEFVIVDNAKTIDAIADIVNKRFIRTAKALIACVVRYDPVFHGLSFEVEDCAAAVENMLLAITALGYASVWIDGNIRLEGRATKIGSLLSIPEPKYVRVILPIGVPAEEPAPCGKKSFTERAYFDFYERGKTDG
jgi:nitroreductase